MVFYPSKLLNNVGVNALLMQLFGRLYFDGDDGLLVFGIDAVLIYYNNILLYFYAMLIH